LNLTHKFSSILIQHWPIIHIYVVTNYIIALLCSALSLYPATLLADEERFFFELFLISAALATQCSISLISWHTSPLPLSENLAFLWWSSRGVMSCKGKQPSKGKRAKGWREKIQIEVVTCINHHEVCKLIDTFPEKQYPIE
jgi:hypothetical protein